MQRLRVIFLSIAVLIGAMTLSAQTALSYPLDTIDGKVYYRYTVERSIGLYRISKNFGVSQEEILQANPHLQHAGLRYDEVIRIPAKGMELQRVETMPVKEEASEPVVVAEERKQLIVVAKRRWHEKKNTTIIDTDTVAQDSTVVVSDTVVALCDSNAIRLAVLLPLHADALKREKNIDRFYDYYAGVLIAINEVQAAGQAIEVFVHDVGKTPQKTHQLFNDSTWPEVDAIIGPAYAQQVAAAATFAKQDSTWLLVPFLSSVADIEQHPYLLQFNPSEKSEADTLARYLAQYGDSVNCVLIETKEGDVVPSGIMALHQALKTYNVPTSTIPLAAILTDSLDGAFKAGLENIVIFNTEKFSNLQAVMPHLIQGHSTYPITLLSRYSWQNEKIILPQIYTTIFCDSLIETSAYKEVWQQYFNHTPSSTQPRYDLLGYDQTRHLMHLLQVSRDSLDTQVWNGIQSNIQYQKISPDGGYENQHIHIIRK